MSILIKGMEMPTSCCECAITSWNGEDDVCPFSGISALSIGRQYDCPLVPVPPHGRLIDADANLAVMMRVLDAPYTDHGTIDTAMLKACIKMFEEAPTIIPAEEGET